MIDAHETILKITKNTNVNDVQVIRILVRILDFFDAV
jgi:hypothetical protein